MYEADDEGGEDWLTEEATNFLITILNTDFVCC